MKISSNLTLVELKELLRQLVKARSADACSYLIEEYLRKFGVKTKRMFIAQGQPILVGFAGSSKPSLPMVLLAHMDVAPVGDESKWSVHPFSGHVEGSELKGRGSCDAKGGIAASLVALRALLESGEPPKNDIYLLLLPDGERLYRDSLSMLGGIGIPPISKVIILEPTALNVATSSGGSYKVVCSLAGATSYFAHENRSNPLYFAARLIGLAEQLHNKGVSVVSVSSPQWDTTTPDQVTFTLRFKADTLSQAEDLVRSLSNFLRRADIAHDLKLYEELPPLPRGESRTLASGLLRSLSELGVKAALSSSSMVTLAGFMLKERIASEVVVFGPGDPLKAHRIDESIDLRDVELACKALYGLLVGGLGY